MRSRLLPVVLVATMLVLTAPTAHAAPPRQELASARERLEELATRLEVKIEECNLRREQLKAVKRAVAANEQDHEQAQQRLAKVADERTTVVAQMYKDRSGGNELSTLTAAASSIDEYVERIAWLDITQQARLTAFERYAATRDRLAASGDVLETTRQQAADANATAQRSCEETRRRVEAEEDRIAELQAEVERLEAAARAREARRERAAAAAEAESTATTATTATTDTAAPAPAPAPAAASGSAATAIDFAMAQLGKPYAWGGSGPNSYDCSGLTSSAWAAAGVSLPHNSGMQYAATTRVSRDALQPGDLVFFGSPIHHVGMYIGNGQMVDAPRTGLTVRVTSIERSNYVGAGRP